MQLFERKFCKYNCMNENLFQLCQFLADKNNHHQNKKLIIDAFYIKSLTETIKTYKIL